MKGMGLVRFTGQTELSESKSIVNGGLYTLEAVEYFGDGRMNYYLKEFPGSQFRGEDFERVLKLFS